MKKNLDNVLSAVCRPRDLAEIFDMPFLGCSKLMSTHFWDFYREFTLFYGYYVITNSLNTVEKLNDWFETKEASDRRFIFGNPQEFFHLYVDYESVMSHEDCKKQMQQVLNWIIENMDTVVRAYFKYVTFEMD